MSTARAAARTAPAPRTRPAPARDRRAHLRVVPDARPRRAGAVLVAAVVVVFASLLGTAVLHTMLVAGQRDLDRLDERIAETRQERRSLELEVAELQSPARIVAEAERMGMVVPDEVIWIAPRPDGGAETSAQTRPGATIDHEVAPEADERAGDDPAAPEDAGTAG